VSSTASIDEVLQSAVAAGHVPNAVAVAATDDGVVYEGAAGPRAAGSDDPVTPDSHFRIMSMTKIVTTTAALQLAEQGKIDLDAPVAEYRPEFDDVKVLTGFDGEVPVLREPASRATVRQLVTHTSGLSYWFWNADIVRWEAATGTPNVLAGSTDAFTAPMVADPGTKIEYGINTDWLGRVVEAAGGRKLDAYVQENITGPLGMTETAFVLSPEKLARCVPIHVQGDDGRWTPTEIELNQQPDYYAGGHGLYSTPRDYLQFQRMLLAGGTLGEAKILERPTIDAMFTNQVGELFFPEHIQTADPASSFDLSLGPGHKWGLGLLLNTVHTPGMRAAGSGAWAGLCNTHFWVDPVTRVTGAIYTQSLPFVPAPAMQLYADFERALYASI
jgi:CubicO group peptidase (beta-lactamase class C family)